MVFHPVGAHEVNKEEVLELGGEAGGTLPYASGLPFFAKAGSKIMPWRAPGLSAQAFDSFCGCV